ncbi:Carbamate kinase [Vibrio aestuarianus]|nr:Carbamate kinase [Vibrio aestuarianus]
MIDKDMTAALIAQELDADDLLILTDGEYVCVDWGKPTEQKLYDETVSAMRSYEFAAGSMGPKVDACCLFAEKSKGIGHIGDLYKAIEVMGGSSGTHIRMG